MAHINSNISDVFWLSEYLSCGSIEPNNFRANRNHAIQDFYPLLDKDYDWVRGDKTRLQTILRRAKQGEEIRIWVGTNADDMCGLYWFMSKIKPYRKRIGKVSLLKLPRILVCSHQITRSKKTHPIFSWGQLEFEDISNHLSLAQEITTPMIAYYAAEWLLLEKENAPLRALVCDCLISVPIDFYDHLILKEIDAMPDTFRENDLLTKVLAKYWLGISAMFVANRITALAEMGKLIVVEDTRDPYHLFHRVFAKPIDKLHKK